MVRVRSQIGFNRGGDDKTLPPTRIKSSGARLGGRLSEVINTGAKEKSRSFERLAEPAESAEIM